MRATDYLLWLSTGAVANAACDRTALFTTRDKFFKNAAQLSPNVKIGYQNKLVTDINTTPYVNLTRETWTEFKVQAADTEKCNIATFRVSLNQLLSTRLAIDALGIITEVEFLQAVQGDQFFRPSGFPQKQEAFFDQAQKPGTVPSIPEQWTEKRGLMEAKQAVNTATCKTGTGEPRALSRKELVYVGSSYADGLFGAPFDACVLGGSSCPRNENGVTTTSNCGKVTGMFGFDVKGRQWTADNETGVVLGGFYFEYSAQRTAASKTNLFLHEYFKIDAGKLAHIYAPMSNLDREVARTDIWS